MTISSKAILFLLLLLFVFGWSTQSLTLFDVGRYSFPLILFVGLPFVSLVTYRSLSFLVLPIASSLFAIAVGFLRGVDVSHVLSQAGLQALAITFAAGIAAINWRQHRNSLERVILAMGIPIVGYGCYQMLARVAHLPGAFLPVTNQQFYVEGGLQREWDKAEVTRASSVFSEPSELGYYCLWLLVIGLSTENKKIRLLSISLAAIGILVSQSLSAVLGAVVISLAYFIVQGISRQIIRQIFLLAVLFAVVAVTFKSLAPTAYDRFSERIVEAASFDGRADSGRVDHLPACIELIKASPVWGYGLSGMAAAGRDGADVTTVNYIMVWMERGTIGALLFFAPWFTLAVRAWLLPRSAGGRTLSFLLLVMTLYSFTSFSITYFLPFWLALGVSASLVLHTYVRTNAKRVSSRSLDPWSRNVPGQIAT
jgi:O-antigen ligase